MIFFQFDQIYVHEGTNNSVSLGIKFLMNLSHNK